jgi:hypothetical protein
MEYFQTKNPNSGKFLEGLAIEDVGIFNGHLVYFTAILLFFAMVGIICCHLVYFLVIWYIFPVLVCWCKKHLATLIFKRLRSTTEQMAALVSRTFPAVAERRIQILAGKTLATSSPSLLSKDLPTLLWSRSSCPETGMYIPYTATSIDISQWTMSLSNF